jgi:hypothetical protein
MNRIVCLTVAILGSALMLQAEDAGKRKATTESHRYYECVPVSENRAACDETAANRGADATPIADGNVFKDAARNSEPQHMGTNMGSDNKNKKKAESAPSDYD